MRSKWLKYESKYEQHLQLVFKVSPGQGMANYFKITPKIFNSTRSQIKHKELIVGDLDNVSEHLVVSIYFDYGLLLHTFCYLNF